MKKNILDRLVFTFLFLIIVLLPIFFLPLSGIPIETSKSLLLVLGLLLSVVFWAIARFHDGKISLPKSWCLFAGGGIILSTLLSALFSSNSPVSFFGVMFDVGSFWFIFAGFLLMFMSAIVFRTTRHAKILLFSSILISIFLLVFQALHIFLPKVLSLGILYDKSSNLLGSWNSFGIFVGFSALLSLLVLEFFSTTKFEKFILEVLIVLSMLLAAIVNFSLVWVLLGLSGLIIFTYKVSINSFQNRNEEIVGEEELKSGFPLASFVVTMIALLFFMSGGFFGSLIPNKLGISNNEVSPSFSSTMSITKSVLKHNPIFGIGPNRFEEAWANYKPATINSTAFWDISFGTGSGLLPTLFATTGYLGILSWIIFLAVFLTSGIKSIFSSIKNRTNWETMAFFVLSFYLFVSAFFYSTGSVIFLLALSFAGIFIGLSSSSSSPEGSIEISFLNDHRKSFFSILFLILVIVLSAALSFKYMERFASVYYFDKTIRASSVSDAEDSISKALTLHTNDLYLRTYGQIYLLKLSSIIQKGGTSLSEQDKTLLQASLDQAINGAQGAALYNSKNYLNWETLGSLYSNLASLGVKDANQKAIDAYKTASSLNPGNPGIRLSIAGVYFSMQDNKNAKEYVKQALELKRDYIEAYLLLSQIAKSEGNNSDAISYAQIALSLAPGNKDLSAYVDALQNGSKTATPPATVSNTTPSTTNTPAKTNKK